MDSGFACRRGLHGVKAGWRIRALAILPFEGDNNVFFCLGPFCFGSETE